MGDNKILYATQNGQCFIKMTGDIRYSLSAGFDAMVRSMFSSGRIEAFVIDLSETRYIDSINLGVMAKIERYSSDGGKIKPVIISDNEDINTILKSVGFCDFFTIVRGYESISSDLQEVQNVDQDEFQKLSMLLDAHKALTQLNEKSHTLFHDVVELLKKEKGSLRWQ